MFELKVKYKDLYIITLIIYLLCLPLNAMNIGPFGSALKVIAVLPIGVSILGGATYTVTKPLRAQAFFTVFAFLSLFWSVSFDDSTGRVLSYVLLFILLMSGTAFKYGDEDIKKIKTALAWSSRMSALTMLIFAEYVDGRFRLNGIITEDPNYMCAYLSFGVIYAISVLAEKSENPKKAKKVLAVIELIVYFYLTLVSGSRGGLIAITAGAAVYLLTFGNKKHKHLIRKIIIAVAIIYLIVRMIDFLPADLRVRFTADDITADGGSGRTDLWKQALDLFSKSGIFKQMCGYGTATIKWCFSHFNYHNVNVVHNMFIETLAELGIIGLITYSMAIFSFIKNAFKFKDKFAFAVIFSMFILSLSTSIYTFKPYFNIMLFIVIVQNMQTDTEKVG